MKKLTQQDLLDELNKNPLFNQALAAAKSEQEKAEIRKITEKFLLSFIKIVEQV